MKAAEEAAFRDYVGARMERLRRTAFLYCRDWHTADDLVGTTLVKLYQHWHRAQRAGNLDAYVHGMLAHAWLDERRRPWRREFSTEPGSASFDRVVHPDASSDERELLRTALLRVPERRRAVLVLRFWLDLSIEQTADLLGCSPGTVRSQSTRGLNDLREALGRDLDELRTRSTEG